MRASVFLLLGFLASCTTPSVPTVHTDHDHEACIFHVGMASTLLGGMYDGFYTVDSLKLKGNFGIGAPHLLDGEILVDEGKVWQTIHTGETFEAAGDMRLPYAAVHHFTADTLVHLHGPLDRDALFAALDALMPERNGMYGVRVSGKFTTIQTRAFPAVTDVPAPALASIMDRQVLFDLENIEGTLVGYRLPAYVEGLNFPGYHFHFLSADTQKGGHMVEVVFEGGTVEIDRVHGYAVQLPDSKAFDDFDFGTDRGAEARTIQRGVQQ